MRNEPMTRPDPHGRPVVDRLRTERGSVVVGAAAVAAVSVLGRTGLTVAGNLPFDPMSGLSLLDSIFSIIAPLSLVVAAGAFAFTVDNSLVKVGLLFVAAFVVLGSISPAAGLPAILGVITGGTVSLVGVVQRETPAGSHRHVPLVGSAILGITISLGGTVGMTPSGAHTVGVGATLVAVALLGLEMPVDSLSVSVGLIAALGVLSVGTWAPFVTGATLLVGFSITNISVLFVAVAALGGVAALTSAVRNRALLPVAGCVLCLFSGVPTTPASAAALVLGLTSVVCREALAHPRGEFA